MSEVELKARTKRFGLRVMKLVDALPNTMAGWAIGSQLVRSGTSVGANYRAGLPEPVEGGVHSQDWGRRLGDTLA